MQRGPVHLRLDLGATRSLTRVCILWGDDHGRVRSQSREFEVQLSTDGAPESFLSVFSAADADSLVDTFASHRLGITYTEIAFTERPVRFVQLVLRATPRKWCNHAIHQVQAWGVVRDAAASLQPHDFRGGGQALARFAPHDPALRVQPLETAAGTQLGRCGAPDDMPDLLPRIPRHLWSLALACLTRRDLLRMASVSRTAHALALESWRGMPRLVLADWARCGGASVVASSTAAAVGPTNAPDSCADGAMATAWMSGPETYVQLEMDLGRARPVEVVQVCWGTAGGTHVQPRSFSILVSADAVRYHEVCRVRNAVRVYREEGHRSTLTDVRLQQLAVRYVRLRLLERQEGHAAYAIRMLNVWGVADPVEAEELLRGCRGDARTATVPFDCAGRPGLLAVV